MWFRVRARAASLDGAEQAVSLIGSIEDVTSELREVEALQERAETDGLTGLRNRSFIVAELEDLLVSAAPGRVGVIFADLDRFKTVNDRHGHVQGDLVLVKAARLLAAGVRPGDHVGRYGGDEFLVVCSELDGAHTIRQIQSRIAEMFDVQYRSGDLAVGLSVGAAVSERGDNAQTLVDRADKEMYRNKLARQRLGSEA